MSDDEVQKIYFIKIPQRCNNYLENMMKKEKYPILK